MTKITKVDVQTSTYQGKEKKSYKFTLADGQTGFCANQKQWEFKEGDDVNYTTEVKTSSKGSSYNLFTFSRPTASAPTPAQPQASITPSANPAPRPTASASPKSAKELKVDAAISAMEFAFNAYCEGKIEYNKITETQRDAANILWKEIDEIFA